MLFGKSGNRCFTLLYHHLPTNISKISSKNIIFINKINNKYIYDSKNRIAWGRRRGSGSCLGDGVPDPGSCLRAAARLWILPARRRAQLWILPARGSAATEAKNLVAGSVVGSLHGTLSTLTRSFGNWPCNLNLIFKKTQLELMNRNRRRRISERWNSKRWLLNYLDF